MLIVRGDVIMRKNEVIYAGPLTGTLAEAKEKGFSEEFGEEFDPIQQMWRVNPVDEADYDGTIGYKDA